MQPMLALRPRKGGLCRWPWLVAMLGLCACTALDPNVPSGFDLSGEWVLDRFASDAPPDAREIRRQEDRDVARGRQRNAAASSSFVAQDFPVVATEHMFIEQNDDSMGIRYANGVYRDVSWGKHERNFWTVDVGWSEDVLYIISSRDNVEGRESMALDPSGRLHVTVRVDTGGRDVTVNRVFRRR